MVSNLGAKVPAALGEMLTKKLVWSSKDDEFWWVVVDEASWVDQRERARARLAARLCDCIDELCQ